MPRFDISLRSPTAKRGIKNLKKKFRKAKSDIRKVLEELENDPSVGDRPPGYGGNVWKKRFINSSISEGKSGGFRILYYWKEGNQTVYPLFFYSKKVMENVPREEILKAVKELEKELEKE